MATKSEKIKFSIGGMTCAGCAKTIETAIAAIGGVRSVAVNVGSSTAAVEVVGGIADGGGSGSAGGIADGRETLEETVAAAVSSLGYTAQKTEDGHHHHQQKTDFRLPTALLLAAVFIADMIHPLGAWFDLYVQLGLATFATFVLGYPLYLGVWSSIRHRQGNMDLLVGIGITAAWGYSVWNMYVGNAEVYFESGVLIIAVVYLGKFLEAKARLKTDAGLASLAKSMPTIARVVNSDGSEVEMPLAELKVGAILAVNPGESIPVDGIINLGKSAVDESLLSGEPIPLPKTKGDKVVAGSINGNNRLLIRAVRVGSKTRLGQILALADETQFHKIPEQKFADRFSAYFSYFVLALAAATLAYWLLVGDDPQKAILAATAVLVAACPCALGLATPAAILSGVDAAAKAGVLICNPESLAKCRRVDTLTLDKTGTLTEGSPKVVSLMPTARKTELLQTAKAVQMGSNHPLALAVVQFAEKTTDSIKAATDIRSVTGKGMVAKIGKKSVVLGSSDFLRERKVKGLDKFAADADKRAQNGESLLFVAVDRTAIGFISFYDKPLASAAPALKALAKQNKQAVLLSGDNRKAVKRLAEMLGISNWHAKMSPEGKAEMVTRLRRQGKVVAAFGDGINDTAMLTAADVGVAVGKSADITAARADLVLLRQDPLLFNAALDIGGRTYTKIRHNLFWAFLYNAAILPIAAAGFLAPAVAASAMALSSISVVVNSLALRLWKPSRPPQS